MRVVYVFGHRRGHRAQPHTADVIIEGWGPRLNACLEEAALGLIEAFADVKGLVPSGSHSAHLDATDEAETLVALLDEIIYAVDSLSVVPVTVTLRRDADGGFSANFATVPADAVVPVGAPPKGISRSDLFVGKRHGRWRCRVEVDV